MERTYGAGAWVELLDAGHDHDPRFTEGGWLSGSAGTSTRRPSTARTWPLLRLWGGEAVPAPARQLGGWEDEAVEQMALHLVVGGEEPVVV